MKKILFLVFATSTQLFAANDCQSLLQKDLASSLITQKMDKYYQSAQEAMYKGNYSLYTEYTLKYEAIENKLEALIKEVCE